jgi:hypothetical protein
MKLMAHIGIWCVVIGVSVAVTVSSFLPHETEAGDGLGSDSSVPALCARADRQTGLNGDPNLRVTTLFKVVGGMPDMESPQRKIRLEFAIAPMKGIRPLLDEAVIVSSDESGEFQIELPPGRYWIGPKGMAVDPDRYDPGRSEIQQMIVEVEADSLTRVDLLQIDYAP